MKKYIIFFFQIMFLSGFIFVVGCELVQKPNDKTDDYISLEDNERSGILLMNLQCKLNFSGLIDSPWKSITPNQWNNMIGPSWVDKGGHFLSRIKMKDRGEAAGIHTPSDLESVMRGGRIQKDPNGAMNRFECVTAIVNSKNGHFTIVYDYKGGTSCEFVTCLFK